MTVSLSFEREHRYGDSHVVAVPVTFPGATPAPFTIAAILDTGAWTSVFSRSIAPRLGISDISTGERERFNLPSGEGFWGYTHAVQIELLGHVLTVPLSFCPDFPPNSPNLLGMRGFFEQLRVAFEHEARRIYV